MMKFKFESLSTERQTIMGFAILWVMFFHSAGTFSRIPLLAVIKRFGNAGVDIFLLLSGIGLYYSALKLRGGNRKRWIIPFFRKRLLRILPATVLCLLPWYVYLYRGQNISIPRFLLDITSLSYWIDGSNRGWYVALTIALYAFYPLCFYMLAKGRNRSFLYGAVLIVLDVILNTAVAIVNPEWFGMVNLALCRVPVFIAGCFLAPGVKEKKEQNLLPLICLSAAVVLALILSKDIEVLRSYGIWRYLYGLFGFCVAVVTAAFFSLIQSKWVSAIFRFFGKYTLELYLTHTQILTVLQEQLGSGLPGAAVNILAVGCSIAAAVMIHEGLAFVIKIIGKRAAA